MLQKSQKRQQPAPIGVKIFWALDKYDTTNDEITTKQTNT